MHSLKKHCNVQIKYQYKSFHHKLKKSMFSIFFHLSVLRFPSAKGKTRRDMETFISTPTSFLNRVKHCFKGKRSYPSQPIQMDHPVFEPVISYFEGRQNQPIDQQEVQRNIALKVYGLLQCVHYRANFEDNYET